MSFWVAMLIWAAARLIAWLMARRDEYGSLLPGEKSRLNEALDKTRELDRLAVSLGCKGREQRGGEEW